MIRLNSKGFHHTVIPIIAVILVSVVGAYTLSRIHALSPSPVTGNAIQVRSALTDSTAQSMCLDDTQNSSADGTAVISFPCDPTDAAQQWMLYNNGTIRIDGKCLDTKTPFNTPGASTILYTCNNAASGTQVWSQRTAPVNGVNVTEIVNGDTPHLCLTDPNGGSTQTQLEVATCTGSADQDWTVATPHYDATAAGVKALQTLYNNTPSSPSRGLFCTGKPGGQCWWESANELNDIINYSEQTGSTAYLNDIPTTYANASNALNDGNGPFLDRYNDDDGWWGLTWLNAYKLTGNKAYLTTAENIFSYIQNNGWSTACGGGVYQFNGGLGADGLPATKDAIANGLYITLAARLYQATDNPAYMNSASGATAATNWFLHSGLIVPSGTQENLVEDHIINGTTSGVAPTNGTNLAASDACKAASTSKSTYNQGMILNGLTAMYTNTGNQAYLTDAENIASAVQNDTHNSSPALVDSNGVLTEPCEGAPYGCDQKDGKAFMQWKGVLPRSLYCLNEAARSSDYSSFLGTNADWLTKTYPLGKAAGPNGVTNGSMDFFGFTWDNYSTTGLSAATQGSALDALLANMGGSYAMCSG